jgi:hypothetical protein
MTERVGGIDSIARSGSTEHGHGGAIVSNRLETEATIQSHRWIADVRAEAHARHDLYEPLGECRADTLAPPHSLHCDCDLRSVVINVAIPAVFTSEAPHPGGADRLAVDGRNKTDVAVSGPEPCGVMRNCRFVENRARERLSARGNEKRRVEHVEDERLVGPGSRANREHNPGHYLQSPGTESCCRSVTMSVKLLIALIVVVALLGACGAADSGNVSADSEQTPEMMAVALVELVTKDNTFGGGPSPFSEYLVQDRIDPSAGEPTASTEQSTRDLTSAEREAIEAALDAYGPVRWIDDPTDWRTPDLTPTIEGAVILGVGEPVIQDETGLVPVSLWCGGLCGTWFTYRLDLIDSTWVVTGIEGSIAIS